MALTKSQVEQFAEAAFAIQKSCACVAWSASECIRLRYPAPIDDIQRVDFFEDPPWGYDESCECFCHQEIAQVEIDIFGEPEF